VSGKAPDRLAGDKSLGVEVHVHRASSEAFPNQLQLHVFTVVKSLNKHRVVLASQPVQALYAANVPSGGALAGVLSEAVPTAETVTSLIVHAARHCE
jgi:hypothetical protein